MNDLKVKNYISELEGVLMAQTKDTLGKVLAGFTSSHEAAFVYDRKENFVGLITPYHTIYRNRKYTPHTIVESALVNPPRITSETSLYEVVEHMLELRAYILPVFDDKENLLGAIYAKDIIKSLPENKPLFNKVAGHLEIKKPITADINGVLGDIFTILREKGVSRVILVDDIGKLVGIVTRRDLEGGYLKPAKREMEKKRFSYLYGKFRFALFDAGEKGRENQPIKKLAKTNVFTIAHTRPKKLILRKLINSRYNSIVLVNTHFRPVGFLSNRDILKAISAAKPVWKVPVIVNTSGKKSDNGQLELTKKALQRFGQKLDKQVAVDRVELSIEESFSGVRNVIDIEVVLKIKFVSVPQILTTTHSRQLILGVREAIKEVERQFKDEYGDIDRTKVSMRKIPSPMA